MDRERERQIVIQGRAQGKSDEFIKQAVLRDRERRTSAMPQPVRTATNWASNVPVLSQLQNFGIGIGSTIGTAGLGLGQAALKVGMGVGNVMNKVAPGTVDNSLAQNAYDLLEKGKQNILQKPFEGNLQTMSGKGGQITANLAPYFATGPATAATWGTRAVQGTINAIPDVVTSAAQSKGDWKTMAATGVTSAIANTVLPGSTAFRKILTGTGTGYVGDVATGLAGLRGEDRTGVKAAIPGWGSITGTGAGFLSAIPQIKQSLRSPERVNAAIDDLEQKYLDIERGWVKTRNASDKAAKVTQMKNKSGTMGRAPERVLAENGIIPQYKGTQFTTKQQAAQLRENVAPLHKANRQALLEAQYGTSFINLTELEDEAIKIARSDKNIASGVADDMETAIRREFANYRKNYGNTITLITADDIKSARWGKTRFSLTNEDKLASDIDYVIAKSAQKKIEDVAAKAGATDVAQLNREIGDLLEASKFLENLDGRSVLYGRMGTHLTRLAGTITGSAAGGFLGGITGAIGGDVVANILRSNSVATPVKRLILKNLQAQYPQAYIQTVKWLQNQGLDRELRLALPEPSYIPMGQGKDPSFVRSVPAQLMDESSTNNKVYTSHIATPVSTQPTPPPTVNAKSNANISATTPDSTSIPTVKPQYNFPSTKLSTRGRQPVSLPNNTTRPLSAAKQELENIKQQIDFEKSALSEFPHSSAKELMRFYKKGDKSLSEVNYQALGTGRKSKDLDSMVTELGFKDMDEAQTAIDNYITARDNIAADKRYYQQLRKEVRSGEDVASYDTPAYTAETLSDADIASITKRLTRERGALGAPSDEWLLAQAKRELVKTPNDAKLKSFIADKELMAEARKYKTADEFVNEFTSTKKYFELLPSSYLPKPKKIYRGEAAMTGLGTGSGAEGFGLYMTTSKKVAKSYADLSSDGVVRELSLDVMPKNPLYFRSPEDFRGYLVRVSKELGMTPVEFNDRIGANKWVTSMGYDGIAFDHGTAGTAFVKYSQKPEHIGTQLTDIWKKANAEKDAMVRRHQGGFAMNPLASKADDLATEARKYKTADEFVKAQGTPVYHGTSDDINYALKNGRSLYFAESEDIAKKYIGGGIAGVDGNVTEMILPKNIKMYDDYVKGDFKAPDRTVKQLQEKYKGYDALRINDFVRFEKEQGYYDGKYHPSILVFPSGIKKIKTRSQLTDIWNKAQNINSRQGGHIMNPFAKLKSATTTQKPKKWTVTYVKDGKKYTMKGMSNENMVDWTRFLESRQIKYKRTIE